MSSPATLGAIRLCDALGDDLDLVRAARLAVWGLCEAGEDDDGVAVHALMKQIELHLEERVEQAKAVKEMIAPSAKPRSTPLAVV